MKKLTFLAIIAMAFVFVGCDQNKPDDYSDYPQLIVGKWFNITPEVSIFQDFQADGTLKSTGLDTDWGWFELEGTYRVEGNKIISSVVAEGENRVITQEVEITNDFLKIKSNDANPDMEEKITYRAREFFDIKGNYTYLNSAVRVVPAEGKTALQLPEGVLFQGQNYIAVDAMHGDRIIDVMKKFFADATFAADGKLNHTMDGEAKVKNYTHNGNNLTFDLYEGGSYKVNATSFPDEDGDRLFIIIPKQAAWLGGMVDLVEKENEGLKLDAAQIAALEKEFMDTFETFTVILSLSKK
jgi:uncharacterized protein (TIGR03066 family)